MITITFVGGAADGLVAECEGTDESRWGEPIFVKDANDEQISVYYNQPPPDVKTERYTLKRHWPTLRWYAVLDVLLESELYDLPGGPEEGLNAG